MLRPVARGKNVTRWIVLLALVTSTSACAPNSGDCCAENWGRYQEDIARSAPVAVAAELVEDGSSGTVVIRPVAMLKGTLPVDDDGLYRFAWHRVADDRVGVWLFGTDGLPFWGDESYMDEFNSWPHPAVPEFPWNMVVTLEPGSDDDAVPGSPGGAIEQVFPEGVVAEARRVLVAADLVVELVGPSSHSWEESLEGTATVAQVLKGDGTVRVGEAITFTYSNVDDSMWGGDLGLGGVWALYRTATGWATVPTWIYSGYLCWDASFGAVKSEFPDYVPSPNPIFPEEECPA